MVIGKSKSAKKTPKNSKTQNKGTKPNSKKEQKKAQEAQDNANPLVDLLNSDHIIQDDDMAVNKALSHVYHHDVYDTLGMLDELGAILIDDSDLKAIHEARELFTAIKYIKENLVAE